MPTLATCPRCFGAISEDASCPGCGLAFRRSGALLDVLAGAPREGRAAEVEGFYTSHPFPGYASSDDAGTILDKSRRAPFLVELDHAIAPRARVLDVGCGTAQLVAFLALAAPDRSVFGIDGCRASLDLAEAFRARTGISNLQLVRADLFDLPVEPGSFEVVLSRGVVHHTPDPREAIEQVARCVGPGGVLVLGFYETAARLFHRARRALAKAVGRPVALLDPVLRRRDVEAEKKEIWIADQYEHPLERILPLPWVMRTLDRLGFQWVRTVPPATERAGLFAPTARPGWTATSLRRAGWALAGLDDPDAGLVCVIARRHPRS